jgi:hypothetical protein
VTTDERQEIDLIESLDSEVFKLPLAIMRDCGPATQTFAGILKVTNRETFTATKQIATKARLPLRTVRRHIEILGSVGYIADRGREHTRAGRPRRTCTRAITAKARTAMESYGLLPWWACCEIRRVGRLPWCARAVLSIVLARLASLKKVLDEQDGHGCDSGDVWGSIANMGDADRFGFPLWRLEADTGLARPAIVDAKRWLYQRAIVQWCRSERDDGGSDTDILMPRDDFRVVVIPASPGHVFLEFSSEKVPG